MTPYPTKLVSLVVINSLTRYRRLTGTDYVLLILEKTGMPGLLR